MTPSLESGGLDDLLRRLLQHPLDVVLANDAVPADPDRPLHCRFLGSRAIPLVGPASAWRGRRLRRPPRISKVSSLPCRVLVTHCAGSSMLCAWRQVLRRGRARKWTTWRCCASWHAIAAGSRRRRSRKLLCPSPIRHGAWILNRLNGAIRAALIHGGIPDPRRSRPQTDPANRAARGELVVDQLAAGWVPPEKTKATPSTSTTRAERTRPLKRPRIDPLH